MFLDGRLCRYCLNRPKNESHSLCDIHLLTSTVEYPREAVVTDLSMELKSQIVGMMKPRLDEMLNVILQDDNIVIYIGVTMQGVQKRAVNRDTIAKRSFEGAEFILFHSYTPIISSYIEHYMINFFAHHLGAHRLLNQEGGGGFLNNGRVKREHYIFLYINNDLEKRAKTKKYDYSKIKSFIGFRQLTRSSIGFLLGLQQLADIRGCKNNIEFLKKLGLKLKDD